MPTIRPTATPINAGSTAFTARPAPAPPPAAASARGHGLGPMSASTSSSSSLTAPGWTRAERRRRMGAPRGHHEGTTWSSRCRCPTPDFSTSARLTQRRCPGPLRRARTPNQPTVVRWSRHHPSAPNGAGARDPQPPRRLMEQVLGFAFGLPVAAL
jgi:hypothetical protein